MPRRCCAAGSRARRVTPTSDLFVIDRENRMTFRRITLIALAVLLLLAVIATLVISRIDTNTYRDALEQAVAERLNATLDIGGPLTLRWFPSPGASAERLSLMQGDTEVASADNAEVSLSWATLWRGE